MTRDFPPGYQADAFGRPVLAGLTFDETVEFNTLDAQLPFEGQHVWPTAGLPRLPLEERWHALWTRHQSAVVTEQRTRLSARRP